jgi:hypothetical protein
MPIFRPHWMKMLCLLAVFFALSAAAQTVDSQYAPRSGDARIDRCLADINDYASRYPASFVDEMARYYTVPRPYVEAMLQQPDWTAGDIYMACALARVAGQPCRAVVREWSRDHSEGWKSVAERLDVKPGSSQYRRLRKDIDETYARWDRPLPAAD